MTHDVEKQEKIIDSIVLAQEERSKGKDHRNLEDQELSVIIIDHSLGDDDPSHMIEKIRGFQDLSHANAFARAYVRDNIELCRIAGNTGKENMTLWLKFGEDAKVIAKEDDVWVSSTEINDFIETPASDMERDWRAIDPRRLIDDDEFATILSVNGSDGYKE